MTDGVAAHITVRLMATQTETAPISPAVQTINLASALALAAGSGVGNATQMLTLDFDIAASGNTTLDLNGSGNVDAFGDDAAMGNVSVLCVIADSTNVNDVVIGNADANSFAGPLGNATQTVKVEPGGAFVSMGPKGRATNSANAHVLKITNGGAGSHVTGKIVAIGRA